MQNSSGSLSGRTPLRHVRPTLWLAWGGRSAPQLVERATAVDGITGREIAAATGMVRIDYQDVMRYVANERYDLEIDRRPRDPLDWVYRLKSRSASRSHRDRRGRNIGER